MTDRLFVENLRLECRVGISRKERLRPQEVVIDVSLYFDLSRAARRDRIGATVNYKAVMAAVSGFISSRSFNLVESVAEGLAALLLESFPAERVSVKVRKKKYSSEPSVGVEVERVRT
ncbi:MAG: dihydroneopterin aldolase [Nitrososphaerota archaeon]|nr:dihydroneopterin aldolase [Nitrososphaerota archaeon]